MLTQNVPLGKDILLSHSCRRSQILYPAMIFRDNFHPLMILLKHVS